MPLLGHETLLARTLARLRRLTSPERTWVLVPRDLERLVRPVLRDRAGVRLILEPEPRDTAAAIALAAARVAAAERGALLAVFPADHHIPDAERFAATLRRAARLAARADAIAIVGVVPTRPDPAYGYLRVAPGGRAGLLRVERFVEKPALRLARRFARSGKYLWNAGIVAARPERVLAEIRDCAPELWRTLGSALETLAAGRRLAPGALARAWRRARPLSFDYAVLERSTRVGAVRARFRWSDLGSWDALAEHLPEVGGNRVHGTIPAACLDAAGNLVWNASGRAIALLGVEGLVIADSGDALLVCARERAQDVRRLVQRVRAGRFRTLA